MSATLLLALLALATQQVAAAPSPELQVVARSASGAEQPEFAHAVSRALVVTGATVVLGTPGAEPCARCVAITVVEEARGRYRIEARQKQRFASAVVEVKADSAPFEKARAVAVETRLLARWPAAVEAVPSEESAPARAEPVRAEPARVEPPVRPTDPARRPDTIVARTEPARPFPAPSQPMTSATPEPERAEPPPPAPVAAPPAPLPGAPATAAAEPTTQKVEAARDENNSSPDPAWSPKPLPPVLEPPVPAIASPATEAGKGEATTPEMAPPNLSAPAVAPAPAGPTQGGVALPRAAPATALEIAKPAPRTLDRLWPWIPTAVGAASALAGGGCAIGARVHYDSLVNRTVAPAQAPGAREDGKVLQTASFVLAGVAAAALAAGIVGFVQSGAPEPLPPVAIGVGPAGSGGVALGVSGSLP